MENFEEMKALDMLIILTMFEELGYELIEDSKSYLRKDKKHMGGEMIDFDKKNKRFRLTRKSCQGNTHFKYGTIQELQAINKQIEELSLYESK